MRIVIMAPAIWPGVRLFSVRATTFSIRRETELFQRGELLPSGSSTPPELKVVGGESGHNYKQGIKS